MNGLTLRRLILIFSINILVLLAVAAPIVASPENLVPQQTEVTTTDPDSNLEWLFAVYTITWLSFFGYVYYMSQKQKALRRDLEEMTRALANKVDHTAAQ